MSSWGSSLPHFSLVQDASDIKLTIGLNKKFAKMLIYIELKML